MGLQGVLPASWRGGPMLLPSDDRDFKAIALHAVDAARSAGASYADVRITKFHYENVNSSMSKIGLAKNVDRGDSLACGVRTLVDGAWGFAYGGRITLDESARLAQAAVGQARSNTWGKKRDVQLGSVSRVADGHWTTPIKEDPFAVPVEEKMEFLIGLEEAAFSNADVTWVLSSLNFQRLEKTFASSEGSLFVQTTYLSAPGFGLFLGDADGKNTASRAVDLSPAGMGYELIRDSRIKDQIPRLVEEAQMKRRATKVVDIGRFDLVFDAQTLASVFAGSIGGATELDRALGYEANAGGTSYLAPPEAMLGQFRLGPEILNVKADRSQPGSCGRVAWDDEGVVPDEFFVVKNGVVNDYQTTREQAAWLEPWYRQQGVQAHSHGCAATGSASDTVIQQRPNISIVPGQSQTSFEDMVASTERGLAFTGGGEGQPDQQYLNWQLSADMVYEIKHGKLTGLVKEAECLIRAPEFWKSLSALGGSKSFRLGGTQSNKGQPSQQSYYSIGTVPAKFTKMNVVRTGRPA